MPTVPWPEERVAEITTLAEQNRALVEDNLILEENLADAMLAYEDRGWRSLTQSVAAELDPRNRRNLVELCRTMATANPLIKRGVTTRIGYIWGQGVEATATVQTEDEDQGKALATEVNTLIDEFWTANASTLTGSAACEEKERDLGTDGEVFLALFTSPLTGRVLVRSTPSHEIVDVINNPDDRDEPWFYIREYTIAEFAQGVANETNTRVTRKRVRVCHPALGFKPSMRPKMVNSAPVRWDAPIKHIPVNRLSGWDRGIPDVFASIAWARAYTTFLSDWAGLVKALSKFAWRATGDTRTKASKMASGIAANAARAIPPAPGGSTDVGAVAAMGPGMNLEAIPKTGATIDADSGKPLAAMAAAGMGVPVTILLADPGVTGARATAETLDDPMILEMGMRRLLWQSALEEILRYVIAASIEAPQGGLAGQVRINDWGRKVITLEGDVEPTIDWTWPPLADLDPVKLVAAIVSADSTGKVHPLLAARLLMSALGVKDVDDWIAKITDESGEFIDRDLAAGDEAVRRARAGEDPAKDM